MTQNTTSEEKNNLTNVNCPTQIIMMGQTMERDAPNMDAPLENIDVNQISDGLEDITNFQHQELNSSQHTTIPNQGRDSKETPGSVKLQPVQVKNEFFQGSNTKALSKKSEPYQPTPRQLKSLDKLSVLPQWRVDLQNKNKEEIEFRNRLKEKYKTEMYGSCDGYLKKLQEIHETKKSISKSFTASKKPAYVPEGKYVPPPKPKKTIEEDKLVFKKRFEYNQKVAKVILEDNLKKSERIKIEKQKEQERLKEEERKKKEMETERKKKETEERRKQLAQMKEKKPPVSGEELHKARMEKLRQEKLKVLAKKKVDIQYPVMKKLASKKKLDTTNTTEQKERVEEKKNQLGSSELMVSSSELTAKSSIQNNEAEQTVKDLEMPNCEQPEQQELNQPVHNIEEDNEVEYESLDEEETEELHDVHEVENDETKESNLDHTSIPQQEDKPQTVISDNVNGNNVWEADHNISLNLSDDDLSEDECDDGSEHGNDEDIQSPSHTKEPNDISGDRPLDETDLIAKKIISELVSHYEEIQGHIQKCFATYANDIFDQGLLSSDEYSNVFSGLGTVRSAVANMVSDLKTAMDSCDNSCDIWESSNIETMKEVYITYIRSLPLALETSLTAFRQTPKFQSLVSSKSNDLFFYLMIPVEMIFSLSKTVQDLVRYRPYDESVKSMLACIEDLQTIRIEITDSNYSTFKVLELYNKLKTTEILSKKRNLLKEGVLSTEADSHSVFLFSDSLVVLTPSKHWFIPFKITDDITGEYNVVVTKDSDENTLEIDEHEVSFHVRYKFDSYAQVKEWNKAFKACLE
ncbi:hypothetical protein C9374_003882 [Naegleria lovaniensis]|uniref:DH domain-containing protein n=1 Tax=Naegleria lovaniensis TaxID=51637 RepID=A0AA88KQD8_NAELO|nr:uncharacterized protein C9374_003882 [Naegleria lovaniensis]KAG2394118.1 hypothetical protein C9374_003882 [Naegleria lovaniensis]